MSMNVRFMQRVDYYVGIPLCLACSLLQRALSLFSAKNTAQESQPKKLLFLELSEMGSAVIAYSSLVQAQERLGEKNIFFLIFERNRESVEITEVVPSENIFVINDKSFLRFAFSTALALWRLRRRKIDTVLDLELFSRCTALLTYLSGAEKRVGFYSFTDEGLYRGDLLTHRVPYNNLQHMALNFLALLEAAFEPASDEPAPKKNVANKFVRPPQFRPSEQERQKAERLLSKKRTDKSPCYIALNPDPGLLALRGWPKENFFQLAQRLLAWRSDVVLVYLGLSSSQAYIETVVPPEARKRSVNLAGKTATLRDLAAVLDQVSLLLSCDSGTAHVATLTSCRSLVLFGPESAARYGPLNEHSKALSANLACSPCYSAANHRSSACTDNQCMKQLGVGQVYDEIIQLLS